MAIGRTFEEALGKAMRSLEDGHRGLGADAKASALEQLSDEELTEHVARATEQRIFYLAEACVVDGRSSVCMTSRASTRGSSRACTT